MSFRSLRTPLSWFAGSLIVIGLGGGLPSLAGAATAPLVRIGSAPVLPQGTQPLAASAAVQTLRVSIALAPRNPAGLNAYANAVADPSSPDYRHYLTTPAFAARFGPSTASIGAVRGALTQAGLRPGALEANHLSLDVVAGTGSLERAFHLDLARVLLPSGKAALVNLQAPALPARVAPTFRRSSASTASRRCARAGCARRKRR